MHDKAFNIAENPKYDGYECRLASMIYKFFDRKASGSGIKNKNTLNKKLAQRIAQINYYKISRTKSTLIYYRQYLECWSCWYAV